MEIDELQAGRELDALVAEKVMGWPVYRARRSKTTGEWIAGPIINEWQYLVLGDELRFYSYANKDLLGRRWHPSEDIAAAWEVVEKLQFQCGYAYESGRPFAMKGMELVIYAETAPLAICRAALKAVGCSVS